MTSAPNQPPAASRSPFDEVGGWPARGWPACCTGPGRRDRLTHVERVAARPGRWGQWPDWAHPELVASLAAAGVPAPWEHQAQAAELAEAGAVGRRRHRHRVGQVALAYLRAGADRRARAPGRPRGAVGTDRPTTLYLSPTKALAADQLRAVSALGLGERARRRRTTATPRSRRATGCASTRRTC